MRVSIDYTQCMGDRNCNSVCPEVFAYDEHDTVSKVKVDLVPAALEGKVRQAAAECPMKAISIEA